MCYLVVKKDHSDSLLCLGNIVLSVACTYIGSSNTKYSRLISGQSPEYYSTKCLKSDNLINKSKKGLRINQQIRALRSITQKIENAHRGLNVEWPVEGQNENGRDILLYFGNKDKQFFF